jgi:uncharacterized spore protein YtfJ
MLLTGIGNSAGDSTVSVGGGGGRTAIQLTSGVDAVVAGGGGGGAGCYLTPSVIVCSGISGTLITHYFACDSERLVDIFVHHLLDSLLVDILMQVEVGVEA